MTNATFRHRLQERITQFEEAGLEHTKHIDLMFHGNNIHRYTIIANEYITKIDVIGTQFRWEEAIHGYQRRNQLDTNNHMFLDDDALVTDVIVGGFEFTHQDDETYILYPLGVGQSSIVLTPDKIESLVQNDTIHHLVPFNRVIYAPNIRMTNQLGGQVIQRHWTHICSQLNVLAQFGYWNLGTYHMLNSDVVYDDLYPDFFHSDYVNQMNA